MNVNAILQEVPSLTREDLYHYERQGYNKPRKVRKGNSRRNDYSEKDVLLVRLLHYYRQLEFWRGQSTKWAYEKALEDINSGRTSPPVFR